MDEIKKDRIKKDIREKNIGRLLKWREERASQNYMKVVRDMSWPRYLAGASVVMIIMLAVNFPFVRTIHYNAGLGDRVEEIMKQFVEQMDNDDRRFQKNLLLKFRAEKQMQVKNVTSEDLKRSKFFD